MGSTCGTNGPKQFIYLGQEGESFLLSAEQALKHYSSAGQGALFRFVPSHYQQIVSNLRPTKIKFTDQHFSPQPASIGSAATALVQCSWLRVGDIFKTPVLMNLPFSPQRCFSEDNNYSYISCALAALTGIRQIETTVFPRLQYSDQGVYAVRLMLEGRVREIVVDDFFPVSRSRQPCFLNLRNGEFWALLIEKALAKWHGTYQAILQGLPGDIMRAVSFAPTLVHPVQQASDKLDSLWQKLSQARQLKYPMCCSSVQSDSLYNEGLQKGHTYVISGCYDGVQCKYGKSRVIKLSDPFGRVCWRGRLSPKDKGLDLSQSRNRDRDLTLRNGEFLMLYEDFVERFQFVDICHFHNLYSHQSLQVEVHKKHARYVRVVVPASARVYFGVAQQARKQNLSLVTFIIGKEEDGKYRYIDSNSSSLFAQSFVIRQRLDPGNYVIYIKAFWEDCDRKSVTASVYSQVPVQLSEVSAESSASFKTFLKQVVLSKAETDPGKTKIGGKDWLCSKMLYECRLAYFVVSVSTSSKNKYELQFTEQQFREAGFRLVKPWRLKPSQLVEVDSQSGALVLVARMAGEEVRQFVFPPSGLKFLCLTK